MQALAIIRRQLVQQLPIGSDRFKQFRCGAQALKQGGICVVR